MKFAVITVCSNTVDVIDACLRSVAEQTYSNIEHVLIDGASTDGTVAVIERFEHVATLVSEPDDGIYDAMNKGLARSSGDYVLFLNADDQLVSPTTIETVAKLLDGQPPGMYYGDLEVRPLDGSPFVVEPPPPEKAASFMVTGCLPHQSTLAHRSVFERVGHFDLRYRYHAEYEWYLKVLADDAVPVRHLPVTIGSFREGGTSSDLQAAQPEVFEIQNSSPLYADASWDRERIHLLQQAWLNERLHVARLSQQVTEPRTNRAMEFARSLRRLASRVARKVGLR